MKLPRITAVFLSFFLTSASAAQIQTPLHVGAFGGIQEPLRPIPVPPEFKSFVPEGLILRAVLQTKMSSGGETVLLYDNGEDIFPEVHLHAIRQRKDAQLLDGAIAGVAGLLPIQTQKQNQVLAFAYHVGADGADTRFLIFARVEDSYKTIFEESTESGQMRVLRQSPLKFELWSADSSLDKGETCVWCPHRYRIKTYVLHADKFLVKSEHITETALDPADVAAQPFVLTSNKK